ncbi:hypothetical protein EYZ11_000551 [Aspergillus tanneri]|uniref:Uncharacterized protein n=1 Tax=Aspergillus tanneri TaxID=1220188 RepID=A0A4S3JWV3_9EURO|nr:hypothetical protein EYZ11_000551 [Aspergillus tanneri]
MKAKSAILRRMASAPPPDPVKLDRDPDPKPVHRRDIDIKRPLIPRLREATWSFHTDTLFSI